nr:hypothetical protein [Paludibacteraceae bacterium]
MKSKLFFLLSVLLMTSCQKSLIAIDGNFDDWSAVPAGRLVQISANENARYNDLYSAKLCADAQNLYFYFEFNGEKGVFNYEGRDTTLNQIEWFDIFLNVDGDQASGFNCWNFKNAGADLLIEGRWSQKFAYAQLHHFPANANQDDWAWEDTKIKAFVTSS